MSTETGLMGITAMFIRSKVVKDRVYYQLVLGWRDDDGRVRHHTVASLGTSPTVKEAVEVEKRRLRTIKRDLAKLTGGGVIHRKADLARVERLNRQAETATAKLELLHKILQCSLTSVDTTAEGSDSDYVRTDEQVAEIVGVSVGMVRLARRLRECGLGQEQVAES